MSAHEPISQNPAVEPDSDNWSTGAAPSSDEEDEVQGTTHRDEHRAEVQRARRDLALGHAQNVVHAAQQCVLARHKQEQDFLQNSVGFQLEDGSYPVEVSVGVARLARQALMADYDLALVKVKECELMLLDLNATAAEARIYFERGGAQLDNLKIQLQNNNLPIPDTANNTPPPALPESILSQYKRHIETFLSINWSPSVTQSKSVRAGGFVGDVD
ncbi:hypothetical protein GALMADRAFT_220047 [Galerina marginata CBS 339.88]|uniref:Uncharacterized protein n=1 Tax=Galerina marginata (strain CBS 339.88) TaxID=685588 RepID=A0A067TWB9_GALM3|nr:hypothetical protein GALMADRAFT_220047 [Galerina marginata CBS 339.88]